MTEPMELEPFLLEVLACPHCRSPLEPEAGAAELLCTNAECRRAYPVPDGIPVLLVDEARRRPPEGGA